VPHVCFDPAGSELTICDRAVVAVVLARSQLFCFLLQVNLQVHADSGDHQMKNRLLDNERIKRASLYITAAALCVLILCVFFKIWRADLRVPFYYSGDSLFYSMFVRGVLDNGWYWQNPALGAPGRLEMYDFPGLDNSVAVLILLFSIFTRNAMLVLNLFYLLTFPLVALASFYVFRQLNFSFATSLLCSLLYAFLPYHFMRNETHFLLSAYYVVPLAVLVLLWVSAEELSPRTRKFILSVAICVLLGSSGIYYPFFFCFLLLIAGAAGSLKFRRLKPLAMALVFVGITCATIAINLSPSIIHKFRHGEADVVIRSPGEAERYGLKISQLLLPITGHRIDRLDRLKRFHNANTLVTENDTASLGIIGSLGFLGLLAQLLHRKEIVAGTSVFRDLSILNIFAVLLGIVGGFAFLFEILVSSGIRSYNRISTFIAFFSLMAVGIALESIYRRTTKGRSIFYFVVVVVLIVGFLDQTTRFYVPDYPGTKAEFLSDERFVKSIETSVPPGAMIFQLPYIPFPENPGVHKMHDYDHFRGYLHSQNLCWSYGTIKNRDDDRAQQRVAALPPEEFVQTLAFAGFSGVYVDRHGYEDGGAAKEAELSNVLQTNPLISPNRRLLFFNLADYGRSLREKYPDNEWEVKKDLSFHPLLLDWKGGFSGFESRPGKSWRWCSTEGELHLRNMSQRPRTIKLEMAFATGHSELDDFIISGLISEQLKVNSSPTSYSKTITVPPGESVIHFRSTAKRVDAPLDPRFLVFRIEDFKVTELQ
jgi:phosphoglycerol transferase